MALKQSENPAVKKMTKDLIRLSKHMSGPGVVNFTDRLDPLVDRVREVLVEENALYEIKEIAICLGYSKGAEVFGTLVRLLDKKYGQYDERKWREVSDVARLTPGVTGRNAAYELKVGVRKPELFDVVMGAPEDVRMQAIIYLEELRATEQLSTLSGRSSLSEPIREKCRDAYERLSGPSIGQLTKEIEEAIDALGAPF